MNPGTAINWASFVEALPEVYLAPIVTGAAAGAVLGFLGVYVVLRRLVFISAALSQVSGLGVALAFYLQIYAGWHGFWGEPVVMALLLSLGATLLVRPDPAHLHLSRDAMLGLVYVVAGGVALFLGTRISQEAHDIKSILFGVGVAVRDLDLWLTLGVGGSILAAHVVLVRGLASATFDPVSSRVRGIPVGALDTFLFFSIAVAVAITTRALGALPVFGFSVLPAIAALALTSRLGPALVVAAGVGALSGVLGYVYAFFTRFPVGASQTVIAGGVAALAIALRMLRSPNTPASWRAGAGLGGVLVISLTLWPLAGTSGDSPDAHSAHTDHTALVADTGAGVAVGRKDPAALRASLQSCADATTCARLAHEAGHLGDRESAPLLVGLLANSDWGVRAEAVEALGKLGRDDVAGPLLERLQSDDNPWVRGTAAEALARVHLPAVRSALAQARSVEKDPDVLQAIARALEHQDASPRAPSSAP
ncbi:MAG: metal ABC transporter permease [Pseudomonadota bacterium]